MESCFAIASFDKNMNYCDDKSFFSIGCYNWQPENGNAKFENKIVNYVDCIKKVIFKKGEYITVVKVLYSVEDTLTKQKNIEVGVQQIKIFTLDKKGHFNKIKDESFEKEYTKNKYWSL